MSSRSSYNSPWQRAMCVANHKATYQIKIRYFFGAKTLATHTVCLFMTVCVCVSIICCTPLKQIWFDTISMSTNYILKYFWNRWRRKVVGLSLPVPWQMGRMVSFNKRLSPNHNGTIKSGHTQVSHGIKITQTHACIAKNHFPNLFLSCCPSKVSQTQLICIFAQDIKSVFQRIY